VTRDWHEHPEAREEFLDAHKRYSAIEDGRLGDEFADAAEAAAELILQWPDTASPFRGRQLEPIVRTWHLGKFPYNVVYFVRDGDIFVLAYAHESRRPGYWAHRHAD
jgi:toxin ParE1/3/4